MIRDFGVALLTALIFGLVFIGIEMLAKRYKASTESVRKLAHMFVGLGAAGFPLFMSFQTIALTGVLLLVGMSLSLRHDIFASVHKVARITYGELYFPIGITLTALIFPDTLLFVYAMLTLGICDALASLVGVAYGKGEFSLFGSHKSFIGSATFLLTCFVLGTLLLMTFTPMAVPIALAVAATMAATLTFIEAICSKGIDNLAVPLSAASLLWMFGILGYLS